MWEARYATNSYYPEHRYDEDDGRLAYRPHHVESNKSLPMPFAVNGDCQRAVLILNRECPCNGEFELTWSMIYDIIRTPWKKLRQRLITECCQW